MNPVGTLDRWQPYGAYSLLQMDLHAASGLPAMNKAMAQAAERQSPEQQLYLQSSWNLPGNMEFDLTGRLVDHLTGFQQAVVFTGVRSSWRKVITRDTTFGCYYSRVCAAPTSECQVGRY